VGEALTNLRNRTAASGLVGYNIMVEKSALKPRAFLKIGRTAARPRTRRRHGWKFIRSDVTCIISRTFSCVASSFDIPECCYEWCRATSSTARLRYFYCNGTWPIYAHLFLSIQAFGLVCSSSSNSQYDGKLAYVPALEDVLVWDVKKGQMVHQAPISSNSSYANLS
jgi:hypothetical protein